MAGDYHNSSICPCNGCCRHVQLYGEPQLSHMDHKEALNMILRRMEKTEKLLQTLVNKNS